MESAFFNSKLPSELEHVTPYIYNNPNKFKITSFESSKDLSDFRWTVDEIEDFKFVTMIYEELYDLNNNFSSDEIFNLLANKPHLMQVNNIFTRNQGMLKSLELDKKIDSKKYPG